MSEMVSRSSQTHHTPQAGLAQIEPLTSTPSMNTVPISADDRATMSHLRVLGAQVADAADKGHKEGQKADPGRGDVKVDDALRIAPRLALQVGIWRADQRQVDAPPSPVRR